MALTSDPHAWLRPLWRRLHSDPAFARLAPESQFDALVREAREVSEKAAAQLAQCDPVTVRAMLGHLKRLATPTRPGRIPRSSGKR